MEKGFPTLLYTSRVQTQGKGLGVEVGEGQGQVQGGREREREMDHSNPVTSDNRSIHGHQMFVNGSTAPCTGRTPDRGTINFSKGYPKLSTLEVEPSYF